MFGNGGFSGTGGCGNDHGKALIDIINRFLLEPVVNHILIIIEIVDLSREKE